MDRHIHDHRMGQNDDPSELARFYPKKRVRVLGVSWIGDVAEALRYHYDNDFAERRDAELAEFQAYHSQTMTEGKARRLAQKAAREAERAARRAERKKP